MTNGRFVHHDDNINESSLQEASHNAEKLYFSKYGVPYKHSMQFFADQTRPMYFGDPTSNNGPEGKGGLAVKPTEPSSCSSRCSTACRSGCQTYCRGGMCVNQCRAACGYVCGACDTKSD